jgi:hypothetical protein
MILQDRYDGREAPFEGDRELLLRHLPADARIVAARATVTPIDFTDGRDPFVETLRFQRNSGDWGATKTAVAGAVEVDLHARRTLAGFQGSHLNGASLLIDLGGAFAAVDPGKGTLLAPGATTPTLTTDSGSLPGVTTSRFRLTFTGNPDVSAVRVRSVPANVSLALRGRPTFWFQVGELTAAKTTPDFSAVLQAWLPQAEVRDGYFILPFVLHADGISRLAVELEIEYLRSASVLPEGLREAKLPYAWGSLPTAPSPLRVSLPAGASLAPGASLGRALGAFEETRVAWGPTGEVTAPGAVTVSRDTSLAQLLKIGKDVETVGVDLLLAPGPAAARLQIDLRQDLDGKPGETSLWPSPVLFAVDPKTTPTAAWISVPLPAPVQIAAATGYWLLLQSLDGEAKWSAAPVDPPAPPGLQRSLDGGLSWRQAATGPPLAALFRLRERPAEYRMPIELQIGTGGKARRVSLKRFNPLKRVELPFALPEIEDAFNGYLAAAGAAGCPTGEHLANGGFEDWIRVGNQLGEPTFVDLNPNPAPQGPAAATVSPVAVAASPDGRRAYVVEEVGGESAVLRAVDLGCDRAADLPALSMEGVFRALAVHPAGARAYVLFDRGLRVVDLAGWRLLGQLLPLAEAQAKSLAVSLDGNRLYMGFTNPESTFSTSGGQAFGGVGGNIAALDTARLEEAVFTGADASAALALPVRVLGDSLVPAALAIRGDGSRLWMLEIETTGSTEKERLIPVETSSLRTLDSQFIDLNGSSRFLALSPDGATAVVSGGASVDLVDLAGRQIVSSFPWSDAGSAAVEPDGGRAFVADDDQLRVIDLVRRSELPAIPVDDFPTGVAVTPQGDRVLMSGEKESKGVLYLLTVGSPRPAAWTLVGRGSQVAPVCVGEPPHRAALLGDTTVSDQETPATNTILAQVVPIAPGCQYELAFDGVASEESAVAEVLWRGADCAAAGSASVPIPVLEDRARPELDLRPARLRLTPPAGATQAEVRFRVPFGSAAVTSVSLRGTAAVLANGDLRAGAPGMPEAWTATPATAPGFSRLASGTAGKISSPTAGNTTRLRNAGAQAVTLAQQVAVQPGPFVLELRGRSTAGTAPRSAPALELRWLAADGSSPAPATVLDVPPESFDALAASGTVPEGAAKAELRITVPPGASLDVVSLDLRFPARVDVPVTFVAEAPGELTLLDWRIAYEEHAAQVPAAPASGLCKPTSAGSAGGAGGEGDDDCGCGEDDEDAKGPSQPGAAVAAPVLAVVPGGSRQLANPLALAATAPSQRVVTEIPGIGRGRARALKAASMDSLETIATSHPAALRGVMRGVTEEAATRFIASARELLRQSPG